jgi:RNA polymerase sigma-70 factor (ECF subfamily)
MEPGRPCGNKQDVSTYFDDPGLTDGDLWRRAAGGDGQAFGLIFDRHGEAVRSYCARRSGSLELADDLVSIVFLEAWRQRETVEFVDGLVLPWLYGVARRSLLHRRRTAARHRAALARLPRELVIADHADGVAERLDDRAHLHEIQGAMARLRPIDRDVLVLCVWQGLDYTSAAVALGVPVGTVRSRLNRARERLRDEVAAAHPSLVPTDALEEA